MLKLGILLFTIGDDLVVSVAVGVVLSVLHHCLVFSITVSIITIDFDFIGYEKKFL
jgi:hypothetical protein